MKWPILKNLVAWIEGILKYFFDENAFVTSDSCIATPSYIDFVAWKMNPCSKRAKLQYYRVLEEIMNVTLSTQRKEVLFKRMWYNTIVKDVQMN